VLFFQRMTKIFGCYESSKLMLSLELLRPAKLIGI
jgi:hypothetical protein